MRIISQFTVIFCIFISLFFGHSVGCAKEPVAVYLTWQRDPTTTMMVQWITTKEDPIVDTIEFQKVKQGSSLNAYELSSTKWLTQEGAHLSLPQKEPYFVHRAELKGLDPDSSYAFRISHTDKEYRFHTMPKDLLDPVTFLVGGDTCQRGLATFTEMNLEAAKQEPTFVLFGGDLAYASPRNTSADEDSDLWLDWIAAYSKTMITPKGYLIPLVVTIGNHDVKGYYDQTPEEAPFFFSLFAMPGLPGYNALHFNDYMSIFLLDSNHCNPIKGAQTKWLQNELSKLSQTLHRFAIYHVPAYPSVRTFHSSESNSIRKHWVPLFEKHGINVVFENNDHAYKRTYPLLDGHINPLGVVYIGDGSWGVQPRIPKKAKESNYLAKTKSSRQFIKVKLTQQEREFWAINQKGEIIDHYLQFVDMQPKQLVKKKKSRHKTPNR